MPRLSLPWLVTGITLTYWLVILLAWIFWHLFSDQAFVLGAILAAVWLGVQTIYAVSLGTRRRSGREVQ